MEFKKSWRDEDIEFYSDFEDMIGEKEFENSMGSLKEFIEDLKIQTSKMNPNESVENEMRKAIEFFNRFNPMKNGIDMTSDDRTLDQRTVAASIPASILSKNDIKDLIGILKSENVQLIGFDYNPNYDKESHEKYVKSEGIYYHDDKKWYDKFYDEKIKISIKFENART